jgi:hypothetical protein
MAAAASSDQHSKLVSVGVAEEGVEMVLEPDAVHSERVGTERCVTQLLDRALLRVDRDADLEPLFRWCR